MRILTCLLVASFCFAPGFSQAEERREGPPRGEGERSRDRKRGPEGGFEAMFSGLDQNSDGALSLAEFAGGGRMSRMPADFQEKLFKRWDRNGDGKIAKAEFPHPHRSGKKHRPMDLDSDGTVTFAEFQKSGRVADKPPEAQRAVFDKLDRNSDGVLNKSDWKKHRPRPGGEGRRHALVDLDTDQDGKISLREFRRHPRHANTSKEQRETQFKKLDKNGDGFIDKNERPVPPRKGRGHSPERRGEKNATEGRER